MIAGVEARQRNRRAASSVAAITEPFRANRVPMSRGANAGSVLWPATERHYSDAPRCAGSEPPPSSSYRFSSHARLRRHLRGSTPTLRCQSTPQLRTARRWTLTTYRAWTPRRRTPGPTPDRMAGVPSSVRRGTASACPHAWRSEITHRMRAIAPVLPTSSAASAPRTQRTTHQSPRATVS